MTKISIAVCLMLLVAISDVYETEAQLGKFSLVDCLKLFPKTRKDFEPYVTKGLLEFVGALEAKSPATLEFKNFFAKLKDYIPDCFSSSRSIYNPAEVSEKSKQLFIAMSALNGTKDGTSLDSWRLMEGLVSMGKVSIEMKKITSIQMSSQEWNILVGSMREWVTRIGLFVKKVSELNGKLIDLAQFDINKINPQYLKYSNEVEYKEAKPFSLPLFLSEFPTLSKDLGHYANIGMSGFMWDLQNKCIGSGEFIGFFRTLSDYMIGFKFILPDTYSIENDISSSRGTRLFVALSRLNGTKAGTANPWELVDGLLSMGECLNDIKKIGSKEITIEQKREFVWSLAKWARAVSQFVKTASEKKGVTIDISSFENYYNSNVLLNPSKGATKKGHGDVSNSTKPNSTKPNSTKPNSTKPNSTKPNSTKP